MKNKPADVPYFGVDEEKIKNSYPILSEKNMAHLYTFITERYKIHLKKDVEKLPPPWTDDPVLMDFKFTNVRREHDKTTKFLLNMLEEHKYDSYASKIMNIIVFRLFNKIETSKLLGWVDFRNFNESKYRNRLQEAEKDFVYFTNAFYTTGMRQGFASSYSNETFEPIRILRGCNHNKYILMSCIRHATNPQQIMDTLKKLKGIGNFLAYQMFVDFTYLEDFPWSENEFVVAGPGCKKGLDYIFEDRDGMNYEESLFYLRDNIEEYMNAISSDYIEDVDFDPEKLFSDLPEYDRHMNIMSLENCMCEISKYIRAIEGTGRPKNKYKGRN